MVIVFWSVEVGARVLELRGIGTIVSISRATESLYLGPTTPLQWRHGLLLVRGIGRNLEIGIGGLPWESVTKIYMVVFWFCILVIRHPSIDLASGHETLPESCIGTLHDN